MDINNSTKTKLFFFSTLASIGYWLLASGYALADIADYKLEVPLNSGQTSATSLSQYIKMVFIFGLGLVGVVALFAVVYSGFRYLVAGSSDTRRQESKRGIWAAVSGLIILLFSYLILATINPQLVSLQEPNLNQQTTVSSAAPYGLEMPLSPSANPTNPADYIRTFFIFGLGIVGLAALFGIVYGGFVYFLSAGNQAMKTHGRRWILSALSGLVLLLCSYAILYTINPQLVSWNGKGLDKISVVGNNVAQPSSPSSKKSQSLVESELKKIESLPQNNEFADLILPSEYCSSVAQVNALKKASFFAFLLPIIQPTLGASNTPVPYVPDVDALPLTSRAYISSSINTQYAGWLAQNLNIIKATLPEEQQAIFDAKDKVFLPNEEYEYILGAAINNGSEIADTSGAISCRPISGHPNSNFFNLDRSDYAAVYHETMHDIDLYNATWNEDTKKWENALSSVPEFQDLYQRSQAYNYTAGSISNTVPEPLEPIPHAGFVKDYSATNRVEYFATLGEAYYVYGGNPARISDDPGTQKLIQEGFDYLLRVGAVKPQFPKLIQLPSDQ